MRQSISLFFTASIFALGLTAALAQSAPATTADTSKGKALVDSKGMTLYVFDKDTAGVSNCNDPDGDYPRVARLLTAAGATIPSA